MATMKMRGRFCGIRVWIAVFRIWGVLFAEPVPGLLDLGLHPLEGAAPVVAPKVLDVLQQQDLAWFKSSRFWVTLRTFDGRIP
jgi:hypothetical protein